MGGGVSYLVSESSGIATVQSYIAGAIAAFAIVCLTCPTGVAMYFLLLPEKAHPVTRSAGALVAAILAAIFHTPIIRPNSPYITFINRFHIHVLISPSSYERI